ncbi:MAG: D-glycero-alpha-D-manno-heptose-7-phosphate kinase [Alphaproteobacteria bacterium]|jgi:D-glycero-alpha-D-manno-heptose-7-phosphate kinase|nr:D-glycero-alpha-D-manno-heptose-7-phosphate kinase [Alphaproteobacteria bacterium]
MIITQTPFRISFFGGGTDFPAWYRTNGGAVLSTTIDKYCYLTCRHFPPFFPNAFRIVWSHIEPVSSISEILHPAVREGLRMMGFTDREGLEIHHQGDLPARAGMGSSAAFANGLILSLHGLKGEQVDRETLYREAIELEQSWLKDDVGSQDQVATACGGLNTISFGPGDAIKVAPLRLPERRIEMLEQQLMLFYTGTSRLGPDIAKKTLSHLSEHADDLRHMRKMVDRGIDILTGDGNLSAFGGLLDEAWRYKRRLSSSISNSRIDDIYARAMAHGALGGKLLGAGGTGFMLFYVPLERQKAIRDALPSCLHVPFKLDDKGASIIANNSNTMARTEMPALSSSPSDDGMPLNALPSLTKIG